MAQRSLVAFTRYTFPAYKPAAHHELVAEKLEAVARGEIKRLLIFMPPRHGKSELASRRFPAWFLGANPSQHIIAASYNADFASDFGRDVRNIVDSQRYRALFSTRLSADSTAANRWHTNGGGMYVAAGIGTATTGRGAHILLIDDPIKDRETADSEIEREKHWRWYQSTAYTRLENDVADLTGDDELWAELQRDIATGHAQPFEGAIVGIGTRWNDDDLFGRLLEAQGKGGDQWEVLELPAILNEGKPDERALWPAKFPLERLEQIRGVIGSRDWSALYQQKPAPDEGLYFKRDWFRWYDERPKHLRIYGASDYAVTDGEGDYTVHLVAGIDPDDNIYVLDVWRKQTNSDVWVESWLDLVRTNKPLLWAEEKGQIVKSIGPFLEKRMLETKTYCRREGLTSAADKPTHSRSIQARASMGKVYLPRGAPWLTDFLSELLTFPAGRTDDQVDAFGKIGRLLDEMVPASVPKEKPKVRVKDVYERAGGRESDSYKTI